MKKILFLLSVIVLPVACHKDNIEKDNIEKDNVEATKPPKTQETPEPLKTPEIMIGDNGNWWIDGKDTGVRARGPAGEEAAQLISITWEEGKMVFTFSDGRIIRLEVEVTQTPGIPEIIIEEPAGGFVADKMQWFRLEPQVHSQSHVNCLWKLNGEEISTDKNVVHVFAEAGIHILTLIATNDAGQNVRNIPVNVRDRNYSPWTTRVYDFVRAPGQHANAFPTIPPGSTYEDVLDIVHETIVERKVVSLGAYGGYIVMGFDHTLLNTPGQKDFLVHGNAFANFAEPGVIEVSWDANGNGLPDDPWYEIAGSEYNAATARRNYRLTYYNPATDTEREAGAVGTRWTDNQGGSGYFPATGWPNWMGDTIEVGGSKYENLHANGSVSTVPFAYGYADNWPNNDVRAHIDIDWAVDAEGRPVHLKGIDFVRVYTGVFAHAGVLGEISTEVAGVQDLNL